MFQRKKWMKRAALMVVCGKMELNDSKKYSIIFGGALVGAGLIMSTLVFPFWNLIREDVYEDVEILSNNNGICYAETKDNIPKTIENCSLKAGSMATIKFGKDLAWAEIVIP